MILTNLNNIFKKDAVLCIGLQASHAVIEEKDDSAKLKKITISDLEKDCLAIGLDEARNIKNGNKTSKIMAPMFRETNDCVHNKACDALVFKEKSTTELDVFYIDLKSDKPTGFAEQFNSSRCFVRYIEAILQNLCNLEIKIGKERYIILHTDSSGKRKSLSKRPTGKKIQVNTPEDPKKVVVLNNDTISFKNLR